MININVPSISNETTIILLFFLIFQFVFLWEQSSKNNLQAEIIKA